MDELDVNNYLIRENLFDLFKRQLKKDFDSCSLNTDFIKVLPVEFEALKGYITVSYTHLTLPTILRV